MPLMKFGTIDAQGTIYDINVETTEKRIFIAQKEVDYEAFSEKIMSNVQWESPNHREAMIKLFANTNEKNIEFSVKSESLLPQKNNELSTGPISNYPAAADDYITFTSITPTKFSVLIFLFTLIFTIMMASVFIIFSLLGFLSLPIIPFVITILLFPFFMGISALLTSFFYNKNNKLHFAITTD